MPSSGASAAQNQVPGLAATGQLIAALEQRKSLIQDANDIKRLQRAYGYYVDEALWDEVADLFADNGSIEIALDGVYVGKQRVREYLYALGGGRSGLSEGELNEHMQLMPVISVAPDGMTAKGRWRAIMLAGELGNSAVWGEGPYENEYLKQDGVWKISKLHWYQSVVVPYEGGWQTNEDVSGGKWVSETLPPDQPSTAEYSTWPETYVPPFHFANPVASASSATAPVSTASSEGGALESFAVASRQAAILAHEVQLLKDENGVENLQRIYGFYIDKGMWTQAADLFSTDGTIEIGGSGIFVGQDRVLKYLQSQGEEYPQPGRLNDRMQLQPVVHIAPDGLSAKGRWHLFAQEAVYGEYGRWGVGVYENDYVKEDGVWKIQNLHAYNTMYTPYEDGWGKTALPNTVPSDELPPDREPSVEYASYPAVFVVPFHYENPVTGAPVYAESAAAFAAAQPRSQGELEQDLASLARELERLEDEDELERLNAIYGYYLAHNQWDNFAGIFALEGSIEIAMRGVYVGRDSVRRSMDLYGAAGIQYGLLHNHMQYQPVIHIADDGQSAKMRSRAFSIMGEYDSYSMWMGGVYENDFVKQQGVWQIQRDQVFNTYFIQYPVGWKDVAPRPPPAISATNPPDLAPTMPFEMYPSAFLPPYHYDNPVTGRPVTWPPPVGAPSRRE